MTGMEFDGTNAQPTIFKKNIKKGISIFIVIMILLCVFLMALSVLNLQKQHNKLIVEYNELYRECKTTFPIYKGSIGDLNQNKSFGLEEPEN